VPVTSRVCQASGTGTVLMDGNDLAMTFPWVLETIARARQDEIRSTVARHRHAQGHCEWRTYRVPRRGALRLLRSRFFGPRVALRLVPSGPLSRRTARTGN
jgi:hypothetical protein